MHVTLIGKCSYESVQRGLLHRHTRYHMPWISVCNALRLKAVMYVPNNYTSFTDFELKFEQLFVLIILNAVGFRFEGNSF